MSGGIGPYDYYKWLEPKVRLPESDKVRAKSRDLPTTVVRFTCDDWPISKVNRW